MSKDKGSVTHSLPHRIVSVHAVGHSVAMFVFPWWHLVWNVCFYAGCHRNVFSSKVSGKALANFSQIVLLLLSFYRFFVYLYIVIEPGTCFENTSCRSITSYPLNSVIAG